jgi:uncharacterized membrane protein
MKFLAVLYRLAVAFWVGGAALFTFVLTPAIFKSYDRDQAGQIVGVLFPGYFRWGLVCGIVALACLLFAQKQRFKVASAAIILVMLFATAYQAFVIEPKAARLKREIPSFVNTPADDPLRQEFRKLHGISMASNLGVIGGGVVLLILL